MAIIEESVEIKRPVDKVFAYTTDAKNWSKWQTIIPTAMQTSPGPVGVGTMFKGTVHMMGLTMKWTSKATVYEPPGKFGKNINTIAALFEQHNTYVPADGGSRFTLRYESPWDLQIVFTDAGKLNA
jgi:uncharacterized protein YndB with AHSA1/START domain